MTQKCYYNQKGALSSYEDTPEGLLIHGVVIMAAGEWIDMHGIKTVFGEEVLQRCAAQWADNAVWTRHSGGTPREVTEKIGAVLNPSYDPSRAAVIGDVLLHNATETSRGASALVRLDPERGGIRDVSAETLVEMDRDGIVMDVTFTGLALVEDGACEVCKLPAFGRGEEMTDEKQETGTEEPQETVEETAAEEPQEPAKDELLDMLVGFIEGLIPESKDIIEEVRASEGEAKARALGKLEGCMSALGFNIPRAEEYAKAVDDRLSAFSKALDEKLATIAPAQYGAPTGLKGRMGADKEIAEERQTATFYGRGRTALY